MLSGGLIWLAFFLAVFLVLFFLEPIFKSMTLRDWYFYLPLSLAMGLITLTFSPKAIQAAELLPHRIHVTAINTEPAECEPVVLSSFISNGEFVSYNGLGIQGWERQEKSLVSKSVLNSWLWRGFTRDLVMTFKGQPKSCAVKITEDGKSTTYELTKTPPQDIIVHLSLVQPEWVQWVTLLSLALGLSSFFLFSIAIFRLIWKHNGVEEKFERLQWCLPKDRIILVVIALGALFAFYFATRQFGLFLVGDSTSYYSAGRSLAAGEGYIMYDGDYYDWWPPLYATFIAGGFIQKVVPVDVYLRLMNAILFMLTMIGWQILILSVFPTLNRLLLTILGLIVAISSAILGSYVYVLSEPGFVLSSIWVFVFLFRFFKTNSINDAIAFCLCVELATLFRYIGLTVVLAEMLIIFVFIKGNFLQRSLSAMTAGLFSSLMGIFWVLRNFILSDSATGLRTPAWVTFQDNIELTINTFSGWFVPHKPILVIVLLAGSLGFFTYQFVTSRKQYPFFCALPPEMKIVAGMVFFFLIYCLYLCVSLSIVENASIGDRLLAPVILPLLTLILFLIDKIHWGSYLKQKILKSSILTLLIISMAFPGVRNLISLAKTPIITRYDRISLNSLQNDQVLAYLKENPLNNSLLVYSNCPYCLNYFLKYYNAVLFNGESYTREYLQNAQEPFYLVWFSRTDMTPETKNGVLRKERTYISERINLNDLADRHFALTSIINYWDGGIYLVAPQ